MQQMRTIALRLAVDVHIEARLQQWEGELAHRQRQLGLYFFHVEFADVVDNFVLVEHAVHVALQQRVFVSVAIAEAFYRLYNRRKI